MRVPETPSTLEDLDLMIRLLQYAAGDESWLEGGTPPGMAARAACKKLHVDLMATFRMLAPLLDRTTSRELETFTMHDRQHALKVVHLMWHILRPERRRRLTPPEIGLLVYAALLHDVGMFLSQEERAARLSPESDLWVRLGLDQSLRSRINELREAAADPSAGTAAQEEALRRLEGAENALLCQDVRDRHATRERYAEVIEALGDPYSSDPAAMPDIHACLGFGGDSFEPQLIEVCVSHNESADVLISPDPDHPERRRFPRDFPVGSETADLHLVAATLRLADILDFDRERTPKVLFYYLLPAPRDPVDSRAALEWSKHLAISHWNIEEQAVVFRGQCRNHVVHHAIEQCCQQISDEIQETRSTFVALGVGEWPFILPGSARAEIHAEGYRYLPYRFELDDERIYSLLMGGALYGSSLVAVRELIQNAVDACKLRDQLTALYEPEMTPRAQGRITVRYEEPTVAVPCPQLTVQDSGTGMDAFILERYFLKVGRSYYRSPEFSRTRAELRSRGLDFAPVSEFGIGFLACFLLADQVVVEAAMPDSPRGDQMRRTLMIDGPTRLIRLSERANTGPNRFRGTRVTLSLVERETEGGRVPPPTWSQVEHFIRAICLDLPYTIALEHITTAGTTVDEVVPSGATVRLDSELEELAVRIPFRDDGAALEGEIVLLNSFAIRERERELAAREPVSVKEARSSIEEPSRAVLASMQAGLWRRYMRLGPAGGLLMRGGFLVGQVPGLPDSWVTRESVAKAAIRMTWEERDTKRFALLTVARSGIADERAISQAVARIWLSHCLKHPEQLKYGHTYGLRLYMDITEHGWLEEFDALTLYKLAVNGWAPELRKNGYSPEDLGAWERSEGGLLWLGDTRHMLYWDLLSLTLPPVAKRVMRLDKWHAPVFFVTPPEPTWQDRLSTTRDFIRERRAWDKFVDFEGESIRQLLYFDYPGMASEVLNRRFEARVRSVFEEDELEALTSALSEVRPRTVMQATLTRNQADVFLRAQGALGDLRVELGQSTVTIAELPAPSS